MPNVLLVVVDTLRADHLGAYGYERPTSPNIDALASQGVLFSQVISQAPWTGASIASLLTGLYPSVHGFDVGVRWEPAPSSTGVMHPFRVQKTLASHQATLAEVLRRSGYTTAGFASSVEASAIFGLAQGFDVYDDAHHGVSQAARRARRVGAETNRRVFRWLDAGPVEPFFLFVHYDDPRSPYRPPPGYADDFTASYEGALTPEEVPAIVESRGQAITNLPEADLEYIVGLYDGEIRYVDTQVGRLLARLDELALSRELLVVLTSDHGEELLEHGSSSHGYTLYDEQLLVPLVMHWPGRLPVRRVEPQVRSIDVLPTILDLSGIDAGELPLQGSSLVSLIGGDSEGAPQYAYAEAVQRGGLSAVRSASGHKLILDEARGTTQLFDLRSDPAERRAVEEGAEETLEELAREFQDWKQRNTALADTLQP
jgi:arylsulfatase A-like enzyme